MSDNEEMPGNYVPDASTASALVSQFAEITGTDVACGQFYLQDRNWDLQVLITPWTSFSSICQNFLFLEITWCIFQSQTNKWTPNSRWWGWTSSCFQHKVKILRIAVYNIRLTISSLLMTVKTLSSFWNQQQQPDLPLSFVCYLGILMGWMIATWRSAPRVLQKSWRNQVLILYFFKKLFQKHWTTFKRTYHLSTSSLLLAVMGNSFTSFIIYWN